MGLDGRAESMRHRIGEHVNPHVRKAQEVSGHMAEEAAAKSRHKLGEWREKFTQSSKGLGEKALDIINPPPTLHYQNYMRSIEAGENPFIPFMQGMVALTDFYGENRAGIESGRFRVLSPDGKLEHSYRIVRGKSGAFRVVDEGVFPYEGG